MPKHRVTPEEHGQQTNGMCAAGAGMDQPAPVTLGTNDGPGRKAKDSPHRRPTTKTPPAARAAATIRCEIAPNTSEGMPQRATSGSEGMAQTIRANQPQVIAPQPNPAGEQAGLQPTQPGPAPLLVAKGPSTRPRACPPRPGGFS